MFKHQFAAFRSFSAGSKSLPLRPDGRVAAAWIVKWHGRRECLPQCSKAQWKEALPGKTVMSPLVAGLKTVPGADTNFFSIFAFTYNTPPPSSFAEASAEGSCEHDRRTKRIHHGSKSWALSGFNPRVCALRSLAAESGLEGRCFPRRKAYGGHVKRRGAPSSSPPRVVGHQELFHQNQALKPDLSLFAELREPKVNGSECQLKSLERRISLLAVTGDKVPRRPRDDPLGIWMFVCYAHVPTVVYNL